MSTTNSKPNLTANGRKFLDKIAKHNGVLIGGAYDDARVSKPLLRDGFIAVERASSGSAYFMLTDAGRAARATVA